MRNLFITIFFLISLTTGANEFMRFYQESQHGVLLAGERHINDSARDKFKESLEDFKASGGDSLGLEMIESHKQHLLNRFMSFEEGSEIDLFNYLEYRWQYNSSNYMELFSKARSLGLKLLAIDLDKRLWPRETGLFPVAPDVSKVRAAREEHMAKLLCEAQYSKIIIIIGSFHAKKRFLPKALMEECYLGSASIDITSL